MQYVLMRKDDVITIADFDEEGKMIWYSQNIQNPELAPLQEKSSTQWLKKWWSHRSIPLGQHRIDEMLKEKGLIGPEEYLLKNLGLSLTDYYWVKPVGSSLKWKDVNLYQNNFRNELTLEQYHDEMLDDDVSKYNPNSSLQGQLEKRWIIHKNERYLVKGNRDQYSTESINEVLISKFHELQGYDNYTDYKLIKINNKEYDYGCISKCFTNENMELVSAYGVVTSEIQRNDISSYEHFIRVCKEHGMDEEQLRRDLEYQILSDFIVSGTDRHLNNISILRDADSLEFLRVAPLYDSGKCLFINKPVPQTQKELLSIETTSFVGNELKMLQYVKDRSLIDITKILTPEMIQKAYEIDSKMDEKHIKAVCDAYEKKIELFRDYQLGKDLNKIKLAISKPKKKKDVDESFFMS